MDATCDLPLGDGMIHIAAPTSVQLTTMRKVVGTYYHGPSMRKQMEPLGRIENIVDVGACIGINSMAMCMIWPDANILALEPHPLSFPYLVANCNQFPNVRPLCMAASDKRETIHLALPDISQRPDMRDVVPMEFNLGMVSRYGTSDRYGADVEAAPLDDLVSWPVDLIKIDVEGAEQTVLNGAKRILTEDRPLLAIELREENLAMGGTTKDGIVDLLTPLRYRYVGMLYEDAVFVYVP